MSNKYVDYTGKSLKGLNVHRKHVYYAGDNHHWDCTCKYCNANVVRSSSALRLNPVSCGCITNGFELKVVDWLLAHGVCFERQHRDKRCKNVYTLPFDFMIKDKFTNRDVGLLEAQSLFHAPWYEGEYGKQQREVTDPIKKEFCRKHNILFREIWFYDDFDAKMHQIMKDMHVNTVPSAS